ncbi:hypothetical protein ANO11243_096070 [Dothideomycetidae sp. 11243]|nr:hypothetical protein ANO11243_096070 [fungal sp. No.11243]
MSTTSSGEPVPNVHANAIVIWTSVGFPLATIALALRLYVRARINKFFGYDDWVISASWVTFTILTSLQIWYGVTVRGDGIETSYDKITLITEWHTFFYTLNQALLKAALGAFYLRVLQERWQRNAVIITTSIFVVYTVTVGFLLLFQCGNPEDVESTNCLPNEPLLITVYVQAGLSVAMDWFLTLLPSTVFFQTQLSARSKASVGLLMMLGGIASTFSIARIPFINTSDGDGDEGYIILTRLLLLSYWENCVAQIGIAAVALRPLFRMLLGTANSGSEQQLELRSYHGAGSEGNSEKSDESVGKPTL